MSKERILAIIFSKKDRSDIISYTISSVITHAISSYRPISLQDEKEYHLILSTTIPLVSSLTALENEVNKNVNDSSNTW